ncbi:MAG: hypothetical protein AAF986_11605 [Pseudomonadota bacterium]
MKNEIRVFSLLFCFLVSCGHVKSEQAGTLDDESPVIAVGFYCAQNARDINLSIRYYSSTKSEYAAGGTIDESEVGYDATNGEHPLPKDYLASGCVFAFDSVNRLFWISSGQSKNEVFVQGLRRGDARAVISISDNDPSLGKVGQLLIVDAERDHVTIAAQSIEREWSLLECVKGTDFWKCVSVGKPSFAGYLESRRDLIAILGLHEILVHDGTSVDKIDNDEISRIAKLPQGYKGISETFTADNDRLVVGAYSSTSIDGTLSFFVCDIDRPNNFEPVGRGNVGYMSGSLFIYLNENSEVSFFDTDRSLHVGSFGCGPSGQIMGLAPSVFLPGAAVSCYRSGQLQNTIVAYEVRKLIRYLVRGSPALRSGFVLLPRQDGQ